MILVVRKRQLAPLLGSVLLILSLVITGKNAVTTVSGNVTMEAMPVVVIDAGHGGEDGGAVSRDGIQESPLNLQIALQTEQILRFLGQRTEMTRREEVSLGDTALDTIRERKVSDIHTRVRLVNECENAVALISVHQNSLPESPVTHGAQAFWNTQKEADRLAELIQDALNAAINRDRKKEPRKIQDSIYLMKHVNIPAVMVECGFLSNIEDTKKLQTEKHQVTLAVSVAAGCLRWIAGEEMTT